jgi:hypothetical protein
MQVQLDGIVARDVAPTLEDLLRDEPAILVEGPRGSGKSTVLQAAAAARGARVLDLDDESVRALVREDPTGAVAGDGLVVIDEFQRAPEVLSAVKRAVDRDPRPGSFLLAGSVSAPLLPTGAETLTGRVHRLTLLPLSAGEILATGAPRLLQVLPRLLKGEPPRVTSTLTRRDYVDLVAAGGYPAALRRTTDSARRRWLSDYLASVADRDLAELVDLRRPGLLARLYRAVADQTASTVARATLAQQLETSPETASAYLDLLAHVHLVHELPGWTPGVSAKAGRRAKSHVVDTGLAIAAVGLTADRLVSLPRFGALLESHVVAELRKQSALVDMPLLLGHFRDRSGVEVDVVLETPDGQVIGIEVKSATTADRSDARGLRFLADRLGSRFRLGLVLTTGPGTAQLHERIWVTPVSSLWDAGARL